MKHRLDLLSLLLLFFATSVYVFPADGAAAIEKDITVNLNGGGDFKSVQEAIDSISDNNTQWTKVRIAAGVYKEKVNISITKSNIILEGEGFLNTSIEWGDYSNDSGGHTTFNSATFTTSASNIVVTGITFKNTHNDIKQMSQAVVASVLGNKSAFYKCRFLGLQDSLFDAYGLHYFKECYIEGYVDFIFGNGQSIYEDCTIYITQAYEGFAGFITAHKRDDPEDPSGFVFKSCTISGNQSVYLGRPWNSNARVIFYETNMPSTVVPEGWSGWTSTPEMLLNVTFVEYNCNGPGSDLSKRVNWEKIFTSKQVETFVDLSYINTDGWIDSLPISLFN